MAYVYSIIVDGVVRYIGKGSKGRSIAHMRMVRKIARRRAAGETIRANHFYNKLTKAWLEGAVIEECIIIDGLTHEEAFQKEILEIAAAPVGQLWNVWSGGEGSSKGYSKSNEQRQKIALSNKSTWTDPELLAKHSLQSKLHWLKPEYRERVLTKRAATVATPEGRARLSEAAKKRWADPEFREQRRVAYETPEFHERASNAAKRGWIKRRSQIGGDN